MIDPAEPDWPLRFVTLPDGTVQFADVEQGTPEVREAAAGVVMSTPRGHRDDDPSFGITALTFQQGAIDTDRLAAELAQSDPALQDVTADEALDLATIYQQRRLTVDVGQAA